MRRFYFGDEDEDDEEDAKFSFPDPSEFIAMTQFEDPNNFILSSAIKLCEKSWFWKFRGISSKINMISDAFQSLKNLIEREDEDAEV